MQQDSTTPAPVRGAIFYSGKLLLFATVGAMIGSALSQLLLSLGLALGFASYWERRPIREVFRLRPLGARGVVRAVATGLCATVLVQVLGALAVILVERSGGKLPQYYNLTNTPFLVALLLLGIIPPVCEEMAYRGYLQHALGALGPRAGVLVTALLFGAMHGSLVRLIPLSLLGLIFGVAVQRSGSLFSSMIMHFVNNAVALGLTYFATGIPSLTVLGVPWLLGVALGLGLLTWVLVRGFGANETRPGSVALPRQAVPAMALVLIPALLIYTYAAWSEMVAVFRQAPPPPPPPPPPAPQAQQTVAPEPLSYRLFVKGNEVTATPLSLASSDPVELVLTFSAPMDRASTELALKGMLPSGTALAWQDDSTLRVTVPEGGSFEVDPTLARDAAGTRTLAGRRQTIERPPATTLLIYRVTELIAGEYDPVYRHRVPWRTTGVEIAPDGETILYYGADIMMGGVPPVLLHLPTGKRTPLDVPGDTYYSGGWLPDGRLFLAGPKLYIGNSLGGELKPLTTIPFSWTSVLSPTGEYLACWGPGPKGLISLLDMRSGEVRQAEGPFRRGAQDGGVTMAWSPDGKLLAGTDHDSDIDGSGARIRIIDPFSGKQVRTIEGVGLRTWLPSGNFLGWETRRVPEDIAVIFDQEGKRIDSFPGIASPSPDRRYLIVGRLNSQGVFGYHLVETTTGAEHALNLSGYPQWAASNLIFVVDRK